MKRCYIIGDPVAHSFSPRLHNMVYEQLGVAHQFTYEAIEVSPKELEQAVQDMKKSDVAGVSVTVPHKIAIMKYLDDIDRLSERIGAVNTVVNRKGKLHGFNTDAIGVITPLLQRTQTTNLDGKKVLIIGAGGAARAAAFVCKDNGARVTISNRTAAKARELAELIDAEVTNDLVSVSDYDIIFNATSVGMGAPNNTDTPLPNVIFSKNQIIFDAIYTPHDTQLLKDAKAQRATTIYGVEMLAAQAIGQIKHFTGYDVGLDIVTRILEEIVHER